MYKYTLLGLLLFYNTLHGAQSPRQPDNCASSSHSSYMKYGVMTAATLGAVYTGYKYIRNKLNYLNAEAQTHPETFTFRHHLTHGTNRVRVSFFLSKNSLFEILKHITTLNESPLSLDSELFKKLFQVFRCKEENDSRSSQIVLSCIERAKPQLAIEILSAFPELGRPLDDSAPPPLHAAVDAYLPNIFLVFNPLFITNNKKYQKLIQDILDCTQEDQCLHGFYSPAKHAVATLHLPTLKYLAQHHPVELHQEIPKTLTPNGQEMYPLQFAWYCEGFFQSSPQLPQAKEATDIILKSIATSRPTLKDYCQNSAIIKEAKWRAMGQQDYEHTSQ